MKTVINLTLGLATVLFMACGNLSAQATTTTPAAAAKKTCISTNTNATSTQDVLVLTGRIIDAASKQPIRNTKINFDKFGDELLNASLDKEGNYKIVLNKDELGEPIRFVFKISGYKRLVIKNIGKDVTHLSADLYLAAEDSDVKSSAMVKVDTEDGPSNNMVIKMQ